MDIQHLHHFTERGHFKKWMAAFDLEFFLFQARNPGHRVGADLFVLLKQFSRRSDLLSFACWAAL